MTLRIACRLLALTAGLAAGQDGPSEKTLEELQQACAYIKVEVAGGIASGSGFLIRRDGDIGYIATNAHVVAGSRQVSIALSSGTAQERTAKAEVIGEDPLRDLAILRVEMKNLPKPLDIAQKPTLRETLPVWVLGFPFGASRATAERGPTIVIVKASISSLRLDDAGALALVQLDGEINPGNSGGPVVTAEGALVGIAVAKIGGTRVGFALAPGELDEMLAGRVGTLELKGAARQVDHVVLRASAGLIDPMKNLKSVSLLVVRRDQLSNDPEPDKRGRWGRISKDAREVPLAMEGGLATASLKIKREGTEANADVWLQVLFVRKDGTAFITEPLLEQLSFEEAKVELPTPPTMEAGDWIGIERTTAAKVDPGRPSTTGTELLGEKSEPAEGVVIRKIALVASGLVPEVAWSDDGAFLYLLDRGGLLRKIAVPALREERRHELGARCSGLVRSKAGLLVTSEGLEELLILSESDLSILARAPVSFGGPAASAPALSVAFVPCGGALNVVDLKSAEGVTTLMPFRITTAARGRARLHANGEAPRSFTSPVVTPDGKYLVDITQSGLHRYRIEGRNLAWEESGPGIRAIQRVAVSGDSLQVCSPGNESGSAPDHPALATGGSYVYKISDLSKPSAALLTASWTKSVAFDTLSGRIYGANEKQLILFGNKGEKQTEIAVEAPVEMRFVAAHPAGGKALVMTARSAFWVEFAKR